MPESLELNDIPVFRKVAELGGLSAAARALGTSKSSISRSISRLEASLGIRLIERTSRNLRLTAEGETFDQYCRQILAAVGDATNGMSRLNDRPCGDLRVSMTAGLAIDILGQALGRFVSENPAITLKLELTDAPEEVNLFDQGIDVAIRFGKLSDSTLKSRILGVSRLIWVTSPAYLEQRGEPETIEELQNHRDHRVMASVCTASSVLSMIGPNGPFEIDMSKGYQTSSDPLAVRTLVVHGAGIAALPDSLCATLLRAGALVHILPQWSSAPININVIHLGHTIVAPKIKLFVDFLLAEAERIGLSPASRSPRSLASPTPPRLGSVAPSSEKIA